MVFANRLWVAAASLSALCLVSGCGGGGTTGATEGGGGTAQTGGTGGTGGMGGTAGTGMGGNPGGGGSGGTMELIPDPGMVAGGEWTDVEPNDTPGQAVPVGILNGPVWAGFVEPYTAISSPTDVDYFVFRSGDAASLPNVNIQICWSFAGNLLDLNLYNVVNSQKGSLVKSAADTAAGCETLIDFGEAPMVVQPDTIYLLEVVAGPGLNLGGDPGLYGA